MTKTIRERYEKINDKLIHRLGHEHPVTIDMIRASEAFCSMVENNPNMAYIFNEDYFKGYEIIIDEYIKNYTMEEGDE